MKNSPLPNSPANSSKTPFLNLFQGEELTDWLSQNGKFVLYGLAAFMVALFLLYQFSSRSLSQQEGDYIKATNAFTSFSNGENEAENLKELLLLMKRHPELHAAYDGTVAQALLNQSDWSEAKPLALATLKRTDAEAFAAYHRFAETSLLVSGQKFHEALVQAAALQQQIAAQLSDQPAEREQFRASILFGLNLLRIGMLHQQLGDTKAELKTWQEWKAYAGLEAGKLAENNQVDATAFRMIAQQLAIGTISLPDYFTYRTQTVIEK